MSEFELVLARSKDGKGKLTVKMNLEQFEAFIKNLPNIERLYNSMVQNMMKTTAVNEKEIKVIMASQIMQTLNSAMPRNAPKIEREHPWLNHVRPHDVVYWGEKKAIELAKQRWEKENE
jgi:hypothetical protein